MSEAPLALAVAADMLAAVNPCGFALLPAYLSFLLIGDDSPSRPTAIRRALLLTTAMTAGFTAVFGVFGLVIAQVAGSLQRHLPWFTIGLGLLLVIVGGWLAAGRSMPSFTLRRGRGPAVTRSVPSMFAFGASYAVASIGCTIGPFLAVVVASFRAGSVATGIGLFLAYAAGMGLAVGLAAVAVALARTSLLRGMRRTGGTAQRVAGLILILVGGYVAYYGWYEIRALRGAVTTDPVVQIGEDAQRWATNGLDRLGAPTVGTVATVLVLLTIALPTLARARATRRHKSRSGTSEQ
jgi:cytochrome c-type biogenesis protein